MKESLTRQVLTEKSPYKLVRLIGLSNDLYEDKHEITLPIIVIDDDLEFYKVIRMGKNRYVSFLRDLIVKKDCEIIKNHV